MKTLYKNQILKSGLLASFIGTMALSTSVSAQIVPTPDHVVVVMMENYSYAAITTLFSSSASYINGLASDSLGALFTNSYAITHPSQPNYIDLFSGNANNVTNDNVPSPLPFVTPNLGAELIAAGKTFGAYSEDLPSVGFTGATSGQYASKHAPWTNWLGIGVNGIPSTAHMPFSSFPSNFNNLPTVSFVIPNMDNDMHNGLWPATSISHGDSWLNTNLSAYINWAKTHNSLLILTWDEADPVVGVFTNQITTIFIGQMVKHGEYNEAVDHYKVLRTIEDMYSLGHAGASSTYAPITDCWLSIAAGIDNENMKNDNSLYVYPNPATDVMNVSFTIKEKGEATIQVMDILSRAVITNKINVVAGENKFEINANELAEGTYFLLINKEGQQSTQKIEIKHSK
jgi:hypothetical protein